MSHKSGHVIIRVVLPHPPGLAAEHEEEASPLSRGPCITIDLPEGCSEEECAQLTRKAYRKLTG